ncbi:mannose-6-phosphate isomerase, class I [Vibrio diabolicus]|uniref:mannose-6-phosphate isomerase, class I n=1 Tax=Vibrio diabolicus TaxID=50719 RepID=UPI0037500484
MEKFLFKMENTIQNYAWGSKTSIASLFGIDNSNNQPQAEIWMGAHPNGCSKVQTSDNTVLLSELIESDKASFLTRETAEKFGELPYLFKVLAAENALSIQVHPNKQEAEAGFKKEDQLGIARTDALRNYRDPNHKPELVYALTPYQAMNGFRSFDEIIEFFSALLSQCQIAKIAALLAELECEKTPKGLEAFFVGILSLGRQEKQEALDALLTFSSQQPEGENSPFSVVVELAETYPGDIGLFAPLMLNVITLEPGQAMYLDARTPHAYLKGTALEVMANSNNVLRAGLTAKHIDIDELAKCTLFVEKPYHSLLMAPKQQGCRQVYPVPVPDFKFDCITCTTNEMIEVSSAEILFAIDGDVHITHEAGEQATLHKGQSLFIPAYAKQYQLSSEGRVARVYN